MKKLTWHKIVAVFVVIVGLSLLIAAIVWLLYLLPKWAIVLLMLFILLK